MADYGKLFEKFLGIKNKEEDEPTSNEPTSNDYEPNNDEPNERGQNERGQNDDRKGDTGDNGSNANSNSSNDNKQNGELTKLEINIDGIDTEVDIDTIKELAEYGYEFQNIDGVLIETMKELQHINKEDVVAMKEFLLNKDINSLKYLLEKSEIDLEQLEEIDGKQPEVENDGISSTVKKYINKLIKKDNTLVEKLNNAVATLDNKSIAEISADDNKHIAFINAVQSGDFEKYLPKAKALTLKNPALSLLEAWAYAYTEEEKKENKKEPKNTDTGSSTNNNNNDLSYDDYFQKFLQD